MKKRMLITAIVAVVVIIGALALASCAEVSTSVTYMSDGEVFKTVTIERTKAAGLGGCVRPRALFQTPRNACIITALSKMLR